MTDQGLTLAPGRAYTRGIPTKEDSPVTTDFDPTRAAVAALATWMKTDSIDPLGTGGEV